MNTQRRGSLRKISAGLLAAVGLAALSGCYYPYYYSHHYDHRGGYYKQDHGKKHHRGGGRYHHRDRYDRDRRKRYKYYRHW